MKVIWSGHFSSNEVSAETAHDVIQDICNRNGKCEAIDLLNASRNENAPLHSLFEWNDSIAAEEYRKAQARLIIRSVYVIEDDNEKETKPIRAFFHIDNTTHNYEPTVIIMKDENKKQMLLETAIRELRMFRTKYSNIVELTGVFSEISKLTEKIDEKVRDE